VVGDVPWLSHASPALRDIVIDVGDVESDVVITGLSHRGDDGASSVHLAN